MRVTDNTRLFAVLRNNASSTTRLTKASRLASAGARVVTASDDPVAYATSVRRGSTVANIASRTRIARSSADDLTVSERALESVTELVSEARSLAVQGSNEALSQNDRNALALRVGDVREQLLVLANTRGSSGFVFGGTRTDKPPFDASGAFTGNDGVLRIPVTDGVAPKMNVSGARAFTAAGGVDVFTELANLQTALGAGDLAGIRGGIGTMQSSHEQVVGVQVDAGLSIERLRSAADVLDEASLAVSQSRIRDVGADDLAGLATDLAGASSAYEQSLTVTKKLLSMPSLAQGW